MTPYYTAWLGGIALQNTCGKGKAKQGRCCKANRNQETSCVERQMKKTCRTEKTIPEISGQEGSMQISPGAAEASRRTPENGSGLKKLYSGKTKDVFLQEDGNVLLYFKDAVTGTEGRIDSGGNEVIGEVAGKGNASFRLTLYFFALLQKAGIPTHFLETGPKENTIIVRSARSFNLEVICREKAWGSFVRRYGQYVEEGKPLPSLVEFTLKDDMRGDPLITEDALVALGIVSRETVDYMKDTAEKATAVIKNDLAARGLELIDIKYEFGEVDGQAVIIDEVSGDSMRVAKDGKVLLQKELAAAILGDKLNYDFFGFSFVL